MNVFLALVVVAVIGLLLGFGCGYLFFKKNGRKVEAKLAAAEAALAALKG
jgi:hypothetical protein